MITFGSVCSGIEAASVAWKPLGWKAKWLAEIEPFPSALLAHHYPDVPNLGDMTKIADWISQGFVGAPDVLVGGTPCQAFSVAGLRGGLADPRGGLTLEYVRILDALDSVRERPAVGLWENVPGVLSSKDNAFGCFLGALVGEDCELVPSGKKWTNAGVVYGPKRTVAWRVLDAQYFGVAQRRKRVFVIASAGNFDPSEILFEFDGLRRDTSPSRETRKGSASSVGDGSMFKDTPILNDQGGSVMAVEDGLVGTLRRETHEPIVFNKQRLGEYSVEDISSTLAARDYKDATDLVAFDAYNQTIDSVFMTLRADKADNEHIPTVYSPTMQVRRLSPTECERLQGFPDGHTDVPYRNKPAADGPRYKALGNSMAVPVIHWLGQQIEKGFDK